MARKLCQCDICGAFYNGTTDGDCGSQDAKHRAARGQVKDDEDD